MADIMPLPISHFDPTDNFWLTSWRGHRRTAESHAEGKFEMQDMTVTDLQSTALRAVLRHLLKTCDLGGTKS